MPKTVFITGTSSGIGLATAKYFHQKGWQVAATMRSPEKVSELKKLSNVKTYRLDVTENVSIDRAFQEALRDFGGIDVLVNNAGYGTVGIFEAADQEQIEKQFDTNLFGVMNLTRKFLPHFRAQGSGTIINVSSVGGRITFPLYSVYHSTKWAVEGFSESLQYEVRPFNIKVKIVEPGAIKTDFYNRSQNLFRKEGLTDYESYQAKALNKMQNIGEKAPGPEIVAKKIFKAANDNSSRMRYPVGSGAPILLFLRRILPNRLFFTIVRMVVEK